jgi:hypothetical protein
MVRPSAQTSAPSTQPLSAVAVATPLARVETRYISRLGPLTLTAFDKDGSVIGQSIGALTPAFPIGLCGAEDDWGTLAVDATNSAILTIEIRNTGDFFAIDDLTISR